MPPDRCLVGLPSACPPISVWWGSRPPAPGSVFSGRAPVRVSCQLVHSTFRQRLLAKRPLDPKAWFSGLSRLGFAKFEAERGCGWVCVIRRE